MKRLAGIFLFGMAVLAFFPACKTAKAPADAGLSGVDLAKELDRLQTLYREAVRVPITPQIVNQIKEDGKDHLLGEIRYFSSVNIALIHGRAGSSSMRLENKELPSIDRSPPAQNPQAAQSPRPAENAGTPGGSAAAEDNPAPAIIFQEIPILTFREGGSSLDQRRITSNDEGRLKVLNTEGSVFEIYYPDRGITLGFSLNQEANWYDLDFAVDEGTGERTSLALTGARPHLMINYQALFPAGETRIQMDRRPESPQTAGPEAPQPPKEPAPPPPPARPSGPDLSQASAAPPPAAEPAPPPARPSGPDLSQASAASPAAEPVPNPVVAAAEKPSQERGDKTAAADLDSRGGQEQFYLEEAPPTPWGDAGREAPYLSRGKDPKTAAAFPAEKTASVKGVLPRLNSYIIQVGAFREERYASAVFAALERAGFCPRYEPHRDLTRVLIPAVERGDLARVREKIKALGLGEPYVRQ